MTTNPLFAQKPVTLIREVNGVEVMSCDALSLLWGVPTDEISTYIQAHNITVMNDFPVEWLKAGRRRVSEAAAATGERELIRILRYWATKDLGADLVLIDNEEADA